MPTPTRTRRGHNRRFSVPKGGPSKTKQSFKDECDINKIMAKYQKTGLVSHINSHSAEYGYATSLDFRQALDTVKKGETLFAELPSSIRRKFDNSPQEFLAFCEDPSNRSEMALLGLLAEETTPSEPSAEAPTDSASAPLPPSPATNAE